MSNVPASDDPIVRLTATLSGLNEHASALDDISKLERAFLALIRAILTLLARLREPLPITHAAPAQTQTQTDAAPKSRPAAPTRRRTRPARQCRIQTPPAEPQRAKHRVTHSAWRAPSLTPPITRHAAIHPAPPNLPEPVPRSRIALSDTSFKHA